VTAVTDPEILKKRGEAEDSMSAQSLISNAHNELHAMCPLWEKVT